MKRRCTSEKYYRYEEYGGKGIQFDPRWSSFDAFLLDMGERPAGTTLDRKNGADGYHKENCRWATPVEQSNNLKNNVLVEYGGDIVPLSLLARQLGVKRETLAYRIKNWPESRWAE